MCFISMPTSIFLIIFFAIVHQTRLSKVIRSPIPADFQFTATQYNLSMFENSIAGTVATVDYSFQGADRNGRPRHFWNAQKFVPVEKMGVYLPKGYHQVQFKIVEGDKQQRFTASAKKLGNFAFLIIEHKHDDDILNRELQGEFSLLIRATAKKKRANALEASAVVNLRILDENDNAPMFRKLDYLAEVDDRVPLNSRIIQLDGFDADEGLNGELYYSMITPSEQFHLEPNSGWIRTFAPLKPGNYSFECLIEDRASRLFYYRQEQDGVSPPTFLRNRAKVIIIVVAARSKNVTKAKIHLKLLPFEPFQPQTQSAASLTIEDPVTEPSQISLELTSISSIANFNTPLLSLQRRSSAEYLVQISHYAHDGPIHFTVEMWDEHSMQRPLATNGQQRTLIISQNVTINPDFSRRRIWFVDLKKTADMSKKATIVVNESVPEGYVVKQFMAETTYAEDRQRIRYKLIPHDENAPKSGAIFPFDLNHHTGQLRLKSSLDFDNPKQQKTFQCTIVANLLLNDKHHPVKSSLTKEVVIKAEHKVILKLADANDNCPKFSPQSFPKDFVINLKSREPKTPTDAVIFKPQVTDADVGDHGQIVYKMIGVEGSDAYFDIDPRNGQIRISVSSLPNTSDSWILKVLAMDLGWPLSHYTQLTLAVRAPGSNAISATNLGLRDTCQMENLHEPVFETSRKQFHVSEDAPVGKEIGSVIATDQDSGYNGLIQYSLSSTTYFGIDLYKGSIFVQRPLTELIRQKADKSSDFFDYSIEVAAKDMSLNNSKSSKITLTIRVHGSNMHTPVFEKPAYFIDVIENNAAGLELARLKATDKDIGNKNGKVEYRLAVDTGDMLSLDPDTGVLRLEKSLDRERDSLREISSKENRVLRAVDRGITVLAMAVDRGSPARIGFVNITIRVIDSNDNAPRCLKSVQKASLLEDSPNGQLVACLSAEDPDMGLNALLNYSIETKDGNVPFRIDSSTGCVFVHTKKPLDYEKTPFYNFSIRVSDHGSPPLYSECAIEINLVDVNENVLPPQFSEIALEGSVEENKPSKTEVLRVHASDPEGTIVTYRLVGGSGLGFFEINSETGVIRTTMELDYETSAFYWLTVRAQDSSNFPLTSHLHLLVILKIEATDPDMNIKNVERIGGSGVKYAIIKGNPQSNFAIDERYIVTGKRRLDRETQAEHEIHVRACDYGTPQLCTTAVVVVAVEDLNDNSPVFPATLNANAINVAADRIGKLCQIFAHDADAPGPNSRVRYELVGQKDDRFIIDEFGRISTSEQLKAGQEYQIDVLAIDGGNPPLQSNATFILKTLGRVSKLTASNRKPLLVDREIWRELYVSDSDSVGITVGIVKAVDEDGDPLWWNVLDDDPIANHTFTFRGNSGELIKIRISRSTTSRPKFVQLASTVELATGTPVGFVPFTAHAIFDETMTGVSHPHKIVYSIHSVDDLLAADLLKIDPSNGNLIVEKVPSKRPCTNFTVVISAKAGGKENFAFVHFRPKFSNEHAPVFIFDQYEFMLQSVTNGIGKVEAYDPDPHEFGRVVYSIVSGNELGYFSLNSTTGEIHLKANKSIPQTFNGIILTVRAMDSAPTPRSTTCSVRILPINWASLKDNEVQFAKDLIRLSLDDSVPIHSFLDSMVPFAASYSFQNGLLYFDLQDACPLIEVHPFTGTIRLRQSLPLILTQDDVMALNCSVIVRSAVSKENTTLQLFIKIISSTISDIHFQPTQINGTILENSSPGSLVKQWSFNIMAQDTSAFPELKYTSTPAFVTISVRDANDIAPEFKEEGYKFRLHLPPIKGLYLGSVRADDSDSVDEVRYALREIKPTSMLRLFYVDRHSGAVYVYSNESSHFGSPTYELKIISSDGIHTTQTTAQVNVIAANSTELSFVNILKFSKDTFTLTVPENMSTTEENAEKMKNMLSLWPVNAHFGERFKFRLLNSHPSFVMDEQSGMLTLNISNPLDREIAPSVQLVIQAESNNGNVPRLATTLINVEVEDINDCAPQFLQQSYTATISEEASVGDRLVNVKAKDQDLGMSGVVRYTLAEDAPAFLDVNKYDGRISIISAPPQSQLRLGKYFEFHVVATDKGNPPLSSRVVVHVQVTNKHQPTFSHTHYSARVSESATPGTQVTSVRAYSNTDGVIGYRIAGGDPYKHFVVDFSKGTLTVNKLLDRELIPQYQLIVEATDVTRTLNGQSVKASATVDIYLDDVNDSSPQFEEPIYEFSVSESATVGTLLGIVRATDSDLTLIPASSPTFQLLDEDERNNNENLNSGNLHYSIVEGNKSVVLLDSNTGQVYLASRVDFEHRHFYEYTIQVRDMDRLTGEAVLQLHIEDANDEPPHFVTTDDQPLILTLRAGAPSQFLHKFEVEDRDTVASTGQKFDFAISEGDETIFHMDSRNGVLSTVRALDAKELNQLKNGEDTTKHLNVSVYDGIFKAFMGVTVQLIVNNTEPLHFEQSVYPIILNENRASANKSSIASVKIRGGSSPVKYSIAGTTISTIWPIAVDQTSGRIFLIERLDREKFPTSIGQSASFNVPIKAVDTAGFEAFTRLEVTVQDENDNEPIWVAPSDGYSMSLDLGNAQEGESLAMVLATDADVDDRLEYSLLIDDGHTNAIDPTKTFDIHPTQGYVTLKKRPTQIDSKLQKDSEQQLTFSIRVSDSGNPPHQNTIPFTMQLISSGNPLNVPPQFSQLHYLFAISEDAPKGKVIGQLQGNDLTQNSRKTTFSITSNNKEQLPFTIDQTTGQLAVTGALDYEQTSRYDFIAQISSTDEDSTTLHTFAVVTVSVVDVNDNAPIFKTIYDRLKIYEDVSPGTIIAVFLATDADKESTNSRIVYTMEQISATGSIEEKAHFTLDGESGWLMVGSEGLDSERRRQYTLRITASDEGGLRNSQDVTIDVMDLNDSPPVFDLDQYIINLNANDIKPNESILRFNVTVGVLYINEFNMIIY
ncbi:cadherin domain-containing protein [Ditylenchus destructor]|nr:cadherin domain-containing protein [Ditylenchus destructor]